MLAESLVGRQRERDRLADALRIAAAGRPRMVVVVGEAGVGKTCLMEHFAADAVDAGALVLTGGCVAFGVDGLPLAPITAALRGLVRRLGTGALPPDLAFLVPELASPGAPAPDQARLFHLVGALLDRLSTERPVVLVIEDLHWADRSTLGLLEVLSRAQRGARVLVAATCRTDDPRPAGPLRLVLAELERLPSVERIELAPLSRAETADLIAGINREPAPASVVDRVFDRSGGNAFFVEELVHAERAGTQAPERSVHELLLIRVEQLPEVAQRVVRVVAAGGRKVSHPLLAAAGGMSSDTLLDGLRGAVEGHVLVVDGEAYVFRHALAWEAVLGSLLPGEAIGLHRAYAAALEERPELLTPDRLAPELAYHWAQAAEPAKALPALLRAASAAEALHAYAEQHHLLTRALDLWPLVRGAGVDRVDVLADAGRAAWHTGQQHAALDLVDEALAEVAGRDAQDDPQRAALLLAQRARFLLTLGREGTLPAAEEAARLVGTGGSAVRARVLEVLAAAFLEERRAEEAREACQEAVRIARELGDDPLRVSVGTTLALTLSELGRHDEALAELAEARALAASRQDLPGLTRVHLNLAAELWVVGRYDEAAAGCVAWTKVAEESGLSRTLGAHLAALGALSLFTMGRWADADARLSEALEHDPPGLFAVLPHMVSGEIAVARGDVETAKRHLAAARDANAGGDDLRDGEYAMARFIALIALAENRVDDAREALVAMLNALPGRGATTYGWLLLNTAARVEARARAAGGGAAESAAGRARCEILRAVAAGLRHTTAPRRALAAQFAAEMASLEGAGGASWSHVVAAWDEIGDPYHGSYARLRAAEAALGHADRPTARALLGHAARQASAIGAAPLLREIEVLARGARLQLSADLPAPGDVTPAQRLGLTPREAEVLRLVTEGRSNRQIAGELVISVKTASVHVSRILTKLGVASRGEAAAAAYRLGLFDHLQRR